MRRAANRNFGYNQAGDMTNNQKAVYRDIADQIKSEISLGTWQSKLPGVRDLSTRFAANPKTVRKALSLLVLDGTLYTSQGLGTFVSQTEEHHTNATVRAGLILSDVSNPNFAQLVHTMQRLAHENEVAVRVNTTARDPSTFRRTIEEYRESGVEIVFVQGGAIRTTTERDILLTSKIPAVGSHASGVRIDNVRPDMRAGARIVTTHLLDTFGAPVGFVSGSDESVEKTGRFSGYCDVHLERRQTIDFGRVFQNRPTYKGGYDALWTIIQRGDPPRSLLLYNEEMAMGAVNALHRAGLRIPDDVGLACFDDSIDPTKMIVPLTTVSYSNQEMAQKLYDLAKRRLTYPHAPPREIEIEMCLTVRQSTVLQDESA